MKCYLQNAPEDEPVYQFIDKKRSEGKPYFVYMTAAANKFLRRYYAKVNEYLVPSENTISVFLFYFNFILQRANIYFCQ